MNPSAQSTPPTTPAMSNGCKPKKLVWYNSSEEYKEFCKLCERKEWRYLKQPPSFKDDEELRNFAEKGVQGHSLNENQIKRMFNEWKNTIVQLDFENKGIFLDDNTLPSANDLRDNIKTSDIYRYYMKGNNHGEFLETSASLTLFSTLRENTKESVNEALKLTNVTDLSGRSKYYSAKKRDNWLAFEKGWSEESKKKKPNDKEILRNARAIGDLVGDCSLQSMHMSLKARDSPSLKTKISDIIS